MTDDRHPESYCHRCLGPNPAWYAPSPLWNAVIGYPKQDYDGIVCPTCFAFLANEAGARGPWRLDVRTWPDNASLTHIDGRIWDPATDLWVEPPAQAAQNAAQCDETPSAGGADGSTTPDAPTGHTRDQAHQAAHHAQTQGGQAGIASGLAAIALAILAGQEPRP